MVLDNYKGRRIVAVEDDPHVLDLIRTTLESAGFVVSGATTGIEGTRRIRDELPDLVLLDVNLPDISGFEVLEDVRRSLGIPCIMLTVQDDEDARVRGLELGADDYIGKPFGHRELVSRIKAVLRRLPFEELSELVNTPLPEKMGIIDIDDEVVRHRLSEEQVKQLLAMYSQTSNATEFQQLGRPHQSEIINLLRKQGASIRQLERLTGLSRGLISRL